MDCNSENSLKPYCNWTQAMNVEFIRLRKELDHRFNGTRNSSTIGWNMVLQQMGLEEKVTNAQAKKKWDNMCKKYRDLKFPERIGKSSDTPIHWPLFHMMDWACSSGEIQEPSEEEERTCDSFQVVIVEEPDLAQNIINDLDMLEGSPLSPKMEQSPTPPPSLPARPQTQRRVVLPRPFANSRMSSRTSSFQNARQAPRPPISPYKKAAAILDAVELRNAEALLSIKESLDELVSLQKTQCETLQAASKASDRLAAATERQALALERSKHKKY